MIIIAFHLPQFHPIPENSAWWGAGFTEWTNVAKSRPLFPGHFQPNIPADTGFYDLRVTETRIQQADLAKRAGISAFCYYHYWFAGKLLLEKPLELLLQDKEPDFPFCLCWANHPWTKHWAGQSNEVLIEMNYPGYKDDLEHYKYFRRYFEDNRYLNINDKPVLVIFKPKHMSNPSEFVDRMKSWAIKDGFRGLYMIAMDDDETLLSSGYDALLPHSMNTALKNYLKGSRKLYTYCKHKLLGHPKWVIPYRSLINYFENCTMDGVIKIPTVIPNWDNTPRIGKRGFVLSGSTPELFVHHLNNSVTGFSYSQEQVKMLFIKSWNEWAEGNYLEPDLRWGKRYLEALKVWSMSIQ